MRDFSDEVDDVALHCGRSLSQSVMETLSEFSLVNLREASLGRNAAHLTGTLHYHLESYLSGLHKL